MTETKTTRTARRGRIFPEIQWKEEQFAEWEAEGEEFYQRAPDNSNTSELSSSK